jgi:hypothetical protein
MMMFAFGCAYIGTLQAHQPLLNPMATATCYHFRCINNLLGASTFLVTCVLHCHRPQNGERPVNCAIAL